MELKTMKTVEEITNIIQQSIGSQNPYTKVRIWPNLVFTDGVNDLRQAADAFWLVDAIASHRRTESFQIWELKVNQKDSTAVLSMKIDTDEPDIVNQEIEYTDFPLDSIKFYVEEGGYGSMEKWIPCLVLMLPNER